MEITTFNPMIVTRNADELVALFEDLGFEMRHSPVVDEEWNKAERHYRMKDANGNHVDISLNPEVPRDVTLIRINVRDFDEAYELLSKRGFKSMLSDKAFNSHNAKIATMASESGLMIALIQHMK